MGLMENKKGSALEKLVSIRWIGVDHTIDKFQVLCDSMVFTALGCEVPKCEIRFSWSIQYT